MNQEKTLYIIAGANRIEESLNDVLDKIHTRDIFNSDS